MARLRSGHRSSSAASPRRTGRTGPSPRPAFSSPRPGAAAFAIEDRTWDRREARAGRDLLLRAARHLHGTAEPGGRGAASTTRHKDYASRGGELPRWRSRWTRSTFAARYVLAHLLEDTERAGRGLRRDPAESLNSTVCTRSALNFAGYLAAIRGDKPAARAHYEELLELNPGNAAVRMRVGYDLARGGRCSGCDPRADRGGAGIWSRTTWNCWSGMRRTRPARPRMSWPRRSRVLR